MVSVKAWWDEEVWDVKRKDLGRKGLSLEKGG